MIELEVRGDGVLLPVKAQPGGRVSAIRGMQDGMLKVSVTQVAERGKANKALVAVLAKGLGVRRSQVELVAGETSSQKRFLIHAITAGALRARLEKFNDSPE